MTTLEILQMIGLFLFAVVFLVVALLRSRGGPTRLTRRQMLQLCIYVPLFLYVLWLAYNF